MLSKSSCKFLQDIQVERLVVLFQQLNQLFYIFAPFLGDLGNFSFNESKIQGISIIGLNPCGE